MAHAVHIGEKDRLPAGGLEKLQAALEGTGVGQAQDQALRALIVADQAHGFEVLHEHQARRPSRVWPSSEQPW